ncbi:hypothetical protein SUGI_0808070 [Cryptomeria japonica]|nr:hypothetical protein SUGI_0808070 [Cryptomeria japonica]
MESARKSRSEEAKVVDSPKTVCEEALLPLVLNLNKNSPVQEFLYSPLEVSLDVMLPLPMQEILDESIDCNTQFIEMLAILYT